MSVKNVAERGKWGSLLGNVSGEDYSEEADVEIDLKHEKAPAR